MPLKNRLFLFTFLVLLAALLAIVFAPVAVSNGLRLWVWWKSRQEGLAVSIDKIDAPFLQPVLIRNFHVKSVRADALQIDLTATQVQLDLNFSRILLHRRGHAIRNLSIEDLHGEIRRENPNVRGITKSGWGTLQRLFPQKCSLHSSEMRVQDGPTLILLRNGTLSASEIEAGRFSAGELMIASPWLRQTFSQLRGATRWDTNRLTLAGLTLARGLDLESVSLDFSRLGSQRVRLEFDADVFGGKIRGNIAHEWHSPRYNWKVAGAATDISLTQTSEAVGLTDRFGGLIRASNFTFRGNLAHPADVTASLWTEVTGLTWRNRTAEAIMLGASIYKRKNDSLTAEGKIEMSGEHNYSGTLDARADNLLDYLSSFRGSTGKSESPIPVDVQTTITSSKWDARGVIRVPDASPISFTANFPLRIGTDWSAFQLSPLNVTVDFPSIFLGKAPQLFHPQIFQDGILSGNISLF